MKPAALIIVSILIAYAAGAQQWKTYHDSATQAANSRQFQQAQMYFTRAEEMLPPDSANSITAIYILKGAGEASLRLGDYTNAKPKLERALLLAEQNHFDSLPLYAIICERMARVFDQVAPEKAETYYLKAADLTRQLYSDSAVEYAASCNSLGNYYYNNTQYQQSLSLHIQAKKIRAKRLGILHAEYARSCNNLGAVYLAMGEYEQAEEQVLEAKKIRAGLKPVNAHPDYAISCTNLANIYREMGQYQKAERLYSEAKDIRAAFEPLMQHADYASSCNILADLYAETGNIAKAETLYTEAMLIRQKISGDQSLAYAESCNNLAVLYSILKKYREAEAMALKAKDIWDKIAPVDNPNHAINQNSLAELYFKMGEYQKSLLLFTNAGNTWQLQLGEKHPYYSGNLCSKARLFNAMKQPGVAGGYYKKAMAVQAEQASRIFRFTSENEKQAYLLKSSRIADEYFSFCIKNPSHADAGTLYNHILSSKGVILSSLLKVRHAVYSSNDTVFVEAYEAWLALKKQLAVLYSNFSVNTTRIRKLEEECNTSEKWLTQRSAIFSSALQAVNWQQIKKQLNANDAAVEFVSFRFYGGQEWSDSVQYAALLIKKQYPSPVFVPLFEKKQLDSIIGKSNQAAAVNKLYTRGGKGIKVMRSTRPLYEIVWKPIEKLLANAEQVFYSPAGQLYRLSFAALAKDKKTMLSDDVTLIMCNSTASAGNGKLVLNAKDKLCLFGGITYEADTNLLKMQISTDHVNNNESHDQLFQSDLHYPFLPGTLAEVERIKKRSIRSSMNVAVFAGSSATEQAFKNLSGITGPSVLHIATHGFYNDSKKDNYNVEKISISPLLKSGLLFAGAQHTINGLQLPGSEDGIATAMEIANMNLPSTRLVVLSACETALGEIQGDEGVYGLQRAFRMAGVSNLVMSLWEVPDKETADFMDIFYSHLFSNKTVQQSFLFAQQTMKKKYRGFPEKWAAWVLVR